MGAIEFSFEGTVLTDEEDLHCKQCDLQVDLVGETCDWLTDPITDWFQETVARAVAVEFDRYIEAGDLEQTRQRLAHLDTASEEAEGFLGMYL